VIDLEGIGGTDGEGDGALADAGGKDLAAFGQELFAIAQAANRPIG